MLSSVIFKNISEILVLIFIFWTQPTKKFPLGRAGKILPAREPHPHPRTAPHQLRTRTPGSDIFELFQQVFDNLKLNKLAKDVRRLDLEDRIED